MGITHPTINPPSQAKVSPESPSATLALMDETALAPGSAASNSHPSVERLKRYLILLQAASF
jgi:hypothetical protein